YQEKSSEKKENQDYLFENMYRYHLTHNGAKMLKMDLIRAIQVKEGNTPCFQSGVTACPQTGCCWWGDCQK
ncbi:MAG: hypothetical protein KJ985_10425, partial [Proteobacteria bacterium]|nr:hypothetical protein [Pseudomonadota bacterium]